MKPEKRKPDTSEAFDDLSAELKWAGDREEIERVTREIGDHLRSMQLPEKAWRYIEIGRAEKRGFAQRLSTALAQKFADGLRPSLKHVVPDARGGRHETRAVGAAGPKKLDVIHMMPEMGVGLALSIKTINFKDEKTARYTKNIKRVDAELRAEASDYHRRQAYSVFAGLVFFPIDAASDGVVGKSSLRHAWDVFRLRGGRKSPEDDIGLFEVIYLCTYDSESGHCRCFSVADEMPASGLPDEEVTLSRVLDAIVDCFKRRNKK